MTKGTSLYSASTGWIQLTTRPAPDHSTLVKPASRRQGSDTNNLKTAGTTRDAVVAGNGRAAATSEERDLFLQTYSGHGGQVHHAVLLRTASQLSPNHMRSGASNPEYNKQKPFSIGEGDGVEGVGCYEVREPRPAHR